MRLSRQLTCLAATLAAVIAAAPVRAESCSTVSPRHVIRFYEYFGAQTPDTANSFEQFRGVIDDELTSINAAINSSQEVHKPITTEPSRDSGSLQFGGRLDPEVSVKLMSVDKSILEVLDGTLLPDTGPSRYVIRSNIYVLARPNDSQAAPFSENYRLDATEFDRARSVHIAALYYALAIDAELNACREQQIKYLSKAAEILKDVKTPGPGIDALRERIAADQRVLRLPR